jgi:Uma2 family endonuclease
VAQVTTDPTASRWTIAELLEALGDVPPDRVRLRPAPGTATERDVIDVRAREGRLCELVDGVLVEKAMGLRESLWACVLIGVLEEFLKRNDLGIVTGPDGAVRLMPGLVRIPDVSFISWGRLTEPEILNQPIPGLAPDLAVEVRSASNTEREMKRKLREYFKAGVRLVWFADPATRTVRVYTSVRRSTLLGEDGTLEGGDVLPGFALSLRDWFARADRKAPPGG